MAPADPPAAVTDTSRPPLPFPAFLRLQSRPVLLVGGGEIALRKWRMLARAGAAVTVVAPTLHEELAEQVQRGVLSYIDGVFDAAQLDGCWLAVAATDEVEVNAAVAAAASERGIYVNVVDDAQRSSFIMPAIIDRAPVTVAVSTDGAAPVLARRLRERIESLLPARLGELAQFLRARRAGDALAPALRRRRIERFLDSPAAEALLAGDAQPAQAAWEAAADEALGTGEVYLVGAGPGDPELLTLRALRLMQQADVVLYDRLMDPRLLEWVRRDAERVFVGKRASHHSLPQPDINAELVRRAQAGQRVLRLKGGDPFIFGRGGEEVEALAAAGIPFQVVPGISAANGCAAYAGIPLTHRDCAQACVFVTGHPRADGRLSLPWSHLVQPGQTVVIYMGLASLAALSEALLEHGMAPDWPAAVVENGTRAEQRVVTGTVSTLPSAVREAGLDGPSLVILGEVVRLRERLQRAGEAHAAVATASFKA
jgi:uroporphyrinogen-III C-methyltransferase (EC 2.1.1.107)/precorrin-2 dehydrogenase (EC 1.3.1.76)